MFEFSCLIIKVPMSLPKKEAMHSNLSLNKIITTTELDYPIKFYLSM